MPVSQRSNDNIATELAGKNVEDSLIKEVQDVLNEGEFARYAPGDAGSRMDQVYTKAMDVISKMENSIKR